MGTSEQTVVHLATRISKEVCDHPSTPSSDVCLDLFEELKKVTITMLLLEKTKIGKLVTKSIKVIKRHKRTETGADELKKWERSLDLLTGLLDNWKEIADKETDTQSKAKTTMNNKNLQDTKRPGLPKNATEYRNRLVTQKKDMYKDPPVLPPSSIVTESTKCPLPKRDKTTDALSFLAGEDTSIQAVLKDFHPNRSPEDVLRAGSFGGTYFRPITSAVTNIHYNAQDVLKDTVKKDWIDGIPMSNLTSMTYNKKINKFGVKCGGSLGMWESSGWMVDSDPYGWFQWYCRFYQGRRCSDDRRQISRWCKSAGPKGRFRSQLCNKISAAQTTFDDYSISPVIRQTLLHWGLEITPTVLSLHRKRVGK
mmetsp:Transcript_44705/g.45344  ORF Transcript_44705/g.45344 Transcript_44705/m.45344 type:complete len:366 (+) Transcript_44705:1-1098(+)